MIGAPKLVGDFWLNSRAAVEGKVVLYDFFTYSCVNCIRTLPHIKKWWNKYREEGLIIIGIHTPEFDFEKDECNVKKSLTDLGVDWPVLLDNEFINWNNFANKYWPAKYLADKNGKIVYHHYGEGNYIETENEIRKLLELPVSEFTEEPKQGSVCAKVTPETYLGYSRGRIANTGGHFFDEPKEYEMPEIIPEDAVALMGPFLSKSEYIESVNDKSLVYLHFQGVEVNLVIHPVGERAVIDVKFDDQALASDIHGSDVDTSSRITVDSPRMYRLIKSAYPLSGILSLRPIEGNFRVYAFTFSGCM